jgi:hypothetical protein
MSDYLSRGKNLYKHGLYGSKLYHVWEKMKSRVNNPNNINYPNYGGRGIGMCEDWNEFVNFSKWANENGYSEELFIDRIDNDGDYEPENCHWVTRVVNANNKRNSRFVEYNGETKTVAQWSRIVNLQYTTLYSRLFYRNMPVEKAMTKEVR